MARRASAAKQEVGATSVVQEEHVTPAAPDVVGGDGGAEVVEGGAWQWRLVVATRRILKAFKRPMPMPIFAIDKEVLEIGTELMEQRGGALLSLREMLQEALDATRERTPSFKIRKLESDEYPVLLACAGDGAEAREPLGPSERCEGAPSAATSTASDRRGEEEGSRREVQTVGSGPRRRSPSAPSWSCSPMPPPRRRGRETCSQSPPRWWGGARSTSRSPPPRARPQSRSPPPRARCWSRSSPPRARSRSRSPAGRGGNPRPSSPSKPAAGEAINDDLWKPKVVNGPTLRGGDQQFQAEVVCPSGGESLNTQGRVRTMCIRGPFRTSEDGAREDCKLLEEAAAGGLQSLRECANRLRRSKRGQAPP
mmetsp:Transcript_62557/g.202799  ORF Transcript_62557/g.202799 Transcript_62557/m.202799 type:complete len:367 (-) Transcript_62557:142-1242(-)